MSLLKVLQDWYQGCCKSENYTGIHIETTDGCSWHVVIDLFDTDYETQLFNAVDIHKDDNDWVRCFKENAVFKGYGGIQNLEDILGIFYKWIIS